jgi:uncharacterized protein (UPF0332 family)
MSFNWVDYLQLARELEGETKNSEDSLLEAKLRTAISRAYYAAFGEACLLLIQKDGITLPREGRHDFVIRVLSNSPYRTRKSIGSNLRRLRDHRNTADYQRSNIDKLPYLTQTVIQLAESVISSIHQLRDSS